MELSIELAGGSDGTGAKGKGVVPSRVQINLSPYDPSPCAGPQSIDPCRVALPRAARSARRSQIESLKDDTYILCSGPSIGTMKRLPWQGDLLRRPARYPMDGRARP